MADNFNPGQYDPTQEITGLSLQALSQDTHTTVALPEELAESIITFAWLSFPEEPVPASTPSASPRWSFYRSAALVSRAWLAILLHTRLAHVVLSSPLDVRIYMFLVEDWMRLRNLRRGASHAELFARSRITISIPLVDMQGHAAAGLTHDIAVTFPDAAHLAIPHYSRRYRALLERHFTFSPSLRTLCLALPAKAPTPAPLARVTHLHLTTSLQGARWQDHLAQSFPSLTHLRLGGRPYALTTLFDGGSAPATLRVLTLDVRPGDDSSTSSEDEGVPSPHGLCDWRLEEALDKGLFAAHPTGTASADAVRRTVVVGSGPGVLQGWEATVSACVRHDVRLERQCLFSAGFAYSPLEDYRTFNDPF